MDPAFTSVFIWGAAWRFSLNSWTHPWAVWVRTLGTERPQTQLPYFMDRNYITKVLLILNIHPSDPSQWAGRKWHLPTKYNRAQFAPLLAAPPSPAQTRPQDAVCMATRLLPGQAGCREASLSTDHSYSTDICHSVHRFWVAPNELWSGFALGSRQKSTGFQKFFIPGAEEKSLGKSGWFLLLTSTQIVQRRVTPLPNQQLPQNGPKRSYFNYNWRLSFLCHTGATTCLSLTWVSATSWVSWNLQGPWRQWRWRRQSRRRGKHIGVMWVCGGLEGGREGMQWAVAW